MRRLIGWSIIATLFGAVIVGCGGGSEIKGTPASRSLELPVAVGLKRDGQGLARAAAKRSTPGQPNSQAWSSPLEIARRYGASRQNAAQVLAKLRQAGFSGEVDATRGFILGSMSVAEAERFFSTSIVVVKSDGVAVAQPKTALKVPESITDQVDEVVGLRAKTTLGKVASKIISNPNSVYCPPSTSQSQAARIYYGMDNYATSENAGGGVSIAMLETEPTSPRALDVYRQCYGVNIPPVTVHLVDFSSADTFSAPIKESTLDIIAASLISPRLSGIDIYQFDPYSSIVFPLAAALKGSYNNGAQIISTSVGFCEKNVSDEQISLSEWILAVAAKTGVTVIAATGDSGSSACAPSDTGPAAQYPASSPFVTAVGGTQFKFQDDNSQGTIIGEEVWNNSPTSQQAGGGSTGSRLPRPDYQKNLSISGGRIVPDISFIASPSAYGQIPVCTQKQKCVMRVVGGTSASAPSVAGALADTIEALSSAEGLPRRLGLLNPTLYALAQQKSESKLFQDITKGNNDLYGTGCCAAKKKYDAASGLGSLKLDKVFSLFGR